MKGWRVGQDGLLRPLIVRTALAFWTTRDVDLWVNQRLLVMHVLRAMPGVDKDTVRAVLDDLARAGMLLRQQPSPKRTVYRSSARFSDPTSPGYAREVDELLADPIPWVRDDGQFLRVGRRRDHRPRVYPVATFPHHFAKHLWMRGWIHACAMGLLEDPEEGLRTVARVAREIPVDFLWGLWVRRNEDSAEGRAGRAFGECRLWRETKRPHEEAVEVQATEPAAWKWQGERGEEALRILHDLCGHDHLRPLLGPSLIDLKQPLLREEFVYRQLDAHLVRRLALHSAERKGGSPAGPVAAAQWNLNDPELSRFDPTLAHLEPRVRGFEEPVLETLGEHRRAWPGGLFSAIR